jgi:hypothetical protein
MSLRRPTCLVLAIALATAPTGVARADAPERDPRVVELKKKGDALLDTKNYAEALTAYDEAYAIVPTATLLYNRGRALQFLGRFPEALDAIERFSTEAPAELRERVPGLQRLLAELRARIGALVVTSNVTGARVLVNEKQIGVTPFAAPVRVAAGHLSVEVFAEGYFPLRRELDLPGAASRTIDFTLVPREAAPAQVVIVAPERPERPAEAPASTPLYGRWWFWTAIGVVVVGGVVTYVALTTDRPTPTGDYSPGVVRF